MKRLPHLIPKPKLSSRKLLNDLSKDRTTLIIAHRLATIKKADRIMVITEDGVAEDGSRAELLSQENGIFAKLHAHQH